MKNEISIGLLALIFGTGVGYLLKPEKIIEKNSIELPEFIKLENTSNGLYIQNLKTKSQYHFNEYSAPNSENIQFTENFFNEDNSVVHDETVLATGFYGEIIDGTHKFKSLYGQCGQIELPENLLSSNALEDIQKQYCVYHTPEQRLIKAGLKKYSDSPVDDKTIEAYGTENWTNKAVFKSDLKNYIDFCSNPDDGAFYSTPDHTISCDRLNDFIFEIEEKFRM
jgi:hypothetical protein